MQHDDLIWQVIGGKGVSCSFKVKVGREQDFCRNEHNVSGLCNRQSCPLANSQYGTIKEEGGLCYLYLKTIERAHTPKYLWEKIELPRNYAKALEIIDQHMEFWTPYNRLKCKQRLTKIHQYLIRMRKLRKKNAPKLVNEHRKVEKREERREEKALNAALLEKSIEKELLERLKQGTYGDIYNFPAKQYEKALEEIEEEEEAEAEEAEAGEEDDEDDEYQGRVEYVEGGPDSYQGRVEYVEGGPDSDDDMEDYGEFDGEEEGEEDDDDDDHDHDHDDEAEEAPSKGKRKAGPRGKGPAADAKKRKTASARPKVSIEYEEESEPAERAVATR
jgi:protein MAK16